VPAHHHEISGRPGGLLKNFAVDVRRFGSLEMDGDPNRILRREKPPQLRERPLASDRFETEWAGAFGPLRQRRNRTGYR